MQVEMSMQSKQKRLQLFGKRNFLALVTILSLSIVVNCARVNSLANKKVEEQPKIFNRLAIKTIMTEDGDIIDCVHIYKQPALDHPLLRNHTIEMRPSFIPEIVKGNNSLGFHVEEIWPRNQSCPEGTIPILRVRETDLTNRSVSPWNLRPEKEFSYCKVEVARAELHRGGPYIGARGNISVWNLQVEENEWSLNSVSLFNDKDSFFEAGWAVSPVLFNDCRPRIFVNWMSTTTNEGCFNLRCPGFIQVSNVVPLGAVLPFVSEYTGGQFAYTFTVYKDALQKNWWVLFEGQPLGYWPVDLIGGFEGGPRINWGGSVCNTDPSNLHTKTQMGSSHFPAEGYTKASYIRNMLVLESNKEFAAPPKIKFSAPYAGCYGIDDGPNFTGDEGPSIFYGGPGGICCDSRCRM